MGKTIILTEAEMQRFEALESLASTRKSASNFLTMSCPKCKQDFQVSTKDENGDICPDCGGKMFIDSQDELESQGLSKESFNSVKKEAYNNYGFQVGQKMYWLTDSGKIKEVEIDSIGGYDNFMVSDENLNKSLVNGFDLYETRAEAEQEANTSKEESDFKFNESLPIGERFATKKEASCPNCKGSGEKHSRPCLSCHGEGTVKKEASFKRIEDPFDTSAIGSFFREQD